MPAKRIGSLDGLRGVAALTVVIYHALLIDPLFWNGKLTNRLVWLLTYTPLKIVWAGEGAVWVFFVLSGFVLVRPYLAKRELRPGRYYARRAIRLYIPFFGSFVLAELLRAALPRPDHYASGWTFVNLLPNTAWDAFRTLFLFAGDFTSLNSVWWTLRWEVWFSLLLPLVVVIVRRFRNYGIAFLAISLITISLSDLATSHIGLIGFGHDNPLAMLPIFGVGVSLAMLEPQIRHVLDHRGRITVAVLTLVGITALTSATALYRVIIKVGLSPGTVWPIVAGPITMGGAGLLVALALAAPGLSDLLEHRAIEWLGRRSYTLYLVHEPLLVAFVIMTDASTFTWWSIPGGIVVSLAATALLYPIMERPALRLIGRIPPGSGSRSTADASAAAT